jgi:hypothetical protein
MVVSWTHTTVQTCLGALEPEVSGVDRRALECIRHQRAVMGVADSLHLSNLEHVQHLHSYL